MDTLTDKAPEFVTVEFLDASGSPVKLIDLGSSCHSANGITTVDPKIASRVEVSKQKRQAVKRFYDYSQNAVPLPDGLASFIRVEGVVVPMGRIRPSKKGHPTREGNAQVVIGDVGYTVTVN